MNESCSKNIIGVSLRVVTIGL